jgi:Fe2+ transport system protein FeoA
MKSIKSLVLQIYEYFHKRWVRTHFQKFKSFNKYCLSYNGIAKLSNVVPGVYKFVAAYGDAKLNRRLLEMGFVPNEEVIVIESENKKSGIMVKIRGSKIALNNKAAEKILIKRK